MWSDKYYGLSGYMSTRNAKQQFFIESQMKNIEREEVTEQRLVPGCILQNSQSHLRWLGLEATERIGNCEINKTK